MLVAVAIAALGYLGAKGNYRNALTGPLPAFATARSSAASGGAGAATCVAIGPSVGGPAIVGAAATRLSDKDKAALGNGPEVEGMRDGDAVIGPQIAIDHRLIARSCKDIGAHDCGTYYAIATGHDRDERQPEHDDAHPPAAGCAPPIRRALGSCAQVAAASQLPRTARGRARSLPSRDARGRFVAFPTTSAPSWYVLCADGYRVPGEAEVMPVPLSAALAPPQQPLPAGRVVRRTRPGMRRDQIVNWVVMLVFLVVMYWYAFSLPVPHR